MEIRHIPSERNPAYTLSRQEKKDALGRNTVVRDANADLVNELCVIQEALMKLLHAQFRDQSESVVV